MEHASEPFILNDLSLPALAAAVKSNLYAFFPLAGKSRAGEFSVAPGLERWATSVSIPWFSGVLAGQPPDADTPAYIEECKVYFKGRGCETFTWWLQPGLALETWRPTLEQAGFGYSDEIPGMAVDLALLPEVLSLPQGVSLRPVESLEELRTWAKVFVPGYGMPAAWEPSIYDLFESLGLDLPIRHYLGRLDGQPVATATLFLAAGTAGIYDVATLPEARGRGLGSALTLFPLLEARRMGYRVGVLQSSEAGFGVYRRLGFEKVCAIDHFYCKT